MPPSSPLLFRAASNTNAFPTPFDAGRCLMAVCCAAVMLLLAAIS
jgi:hypothetical protein